MTGCKFCVFKKQDAEDPVVYCTICLPKGNKRYKKLVNDLQTRKINPE